MVLFSGWSLRMAVSYGLRREYIFAGIYLLTGLVILLYVPDMRLAISLNAMIIAVIQFCNGLAGFVEFLHKNPVIADAGEDPEDVAV